MSSLGLRFLLVLTLHIGYEDEMQTFTYDVNYPDIQTKMTGGGSFSPAAL